MTEVKIEATARVLEAKLPARCVQECIDAAVLAEMPVLEVRNLVRRYAEAALEKIPHATAVVASHFQARKNALEMASKG